MTTTTDLRRPNFFPGQYLDAEDLAVAQEYQRTQAQRHWLAAHTWGIAAGLELEERPHANDPSVVDVHLQPGYAVDGFGRVIVVLEPSRIPQELFKQFPADSAKWVALWLRYREQKTDAVRPDLGVCDSCDPSSRVREFFQVIPGDIATVAQQRDRINVAGKFVEAEAEVTHASVSYQRFPEADNDARWLVLLGHVRWSGTNFVASATDDEKARARRDRRYIGVVAESIFPPTGKLRVDGKAGIGTTDPRNPFAVRAAGDSEELISFESPDGTTKWHINQNLGGTNSGLNFVETGKADGRLFLRSGGSVGIGKTDPQATLDVAGDIHASGTITSGSDARFKKNVRPLTAILEKLDRIHGVTFEGTDLQKTLGGGRSREIGVIAQELETVFPELVVKRGPEDYRAIDYGRLTVILLEAVKELKGQVDNLNDRINQLQSPGTKRAPRKKSRRPLRKAP
jgi:hypothetical protein